LNEIPSEGFPNFSVQFLQLRFEALDFCLNHPGIEEYLGDPGIGRDAEFKPSKEATVPKKKTEVRWLQMGTQLSPFASR
jgi:hypothetical protein